MPKTAHIPSVSALLVGLALLARAASAQATLDDAARAAEDERPAPAAQRVEPVLDAWWQDAVFYQVFVRSFADSTEGPLAHDGIGDFQGLIERLDYLNDGDPDTNEDLGITAIWLMPVKESPSYHGYDTSDYRRIEPDYGTNEDFLRFMEACQERGVRVIIDYVINHCSSDHPWFQAALDPDSEYRDWFVWRDDHPGWRGPWGQNVWHPSPARDGTFYYGLFWRGMPDLNFEHEPVTEAFFDITRFWLRDMRVDGFRLDAIRHLIEDGRIQENTPATHAWLRRFHAFVRAVEPEAFTVGEVWSGSDDVSRYVGDQMDVAFEFDLAYRIVDALRDQRAAPLADQLARIKRLYPLGMYATFLRNHDQPRVLHELGGDRDAARLAATIQLTLPGVPFIYYGEEIGMKADKPDPQLRTPMQWSADRHAGFSTHTPWIAPKPDHTSVNVAAQTDDPDSLLSHYRRLIRLRLATPALRTGELTRVRAAHPGVLAFTRTLDDDTLLCIFNLTDGPVAARDAGLAEAFTPAAELLRATPVAAGEDGPIPVLEPRTGYVVRLRP